MKEVFGNMNKKLILSVLFLVSVLSADDEIYINQNGNNASVDLEQLGSNNLIGGTDSVAGTLTALDLDGASMTLDINQIGSQISLDQMLLMVKVSQAFLSLLVILMFTIC